MLYHLHELQRRFLNPLSVWAQATSELFSSPYSPLSYTPLSRRLSAGYDLLHRVGKQYEKPEFGLKSTRVDDIDVPVVEEVPDREAVLPAAALQARFPERSRSVRPTRGC